MKINLSIKKGQQIRAHYLFFVIVGIQIGVGFLSAPRYIFEQARQDAWIAIIAAYLLMTLVTKTMFVILSRYECADIFGIQVDVFGKWLGKLLGIVYLLLFTGELLSLLLSYNEVIQIFIYPTIPSFVMPFILLILIIYSVLGGIRIVVGVVFLFVIMSPWFFPLLYDPITRMESAHFLPLFDASLVDLLKGAKTTSYSFFGLEILFIIYPFIDNKEKAKRPTYLGIATSALVVLLTTIISIGYYSPNDFDFLDWPVLSLFKSVSFSFMERFDYFIIAEWMMVIIPTAILLMWAIVYGAERIFQAPQKITLYVVSIIILVLCTIIDTVIDIQKVTNFITSFGFWVIFVYPFVLLPLVLLKTKGKVSKEVQNE